MAFPRRVLALLCDGFQVEAALLVRRKGTWHLQAQQRLPWNHSPRELPARLDELDPGGKAPVVAAVPEAVLAQVELPVLPSAPLAEDEMQQLLAWELGPLVAQAGRGPTLREALWGLGLVSAEELPREDVPGRHAAAAGALDGEELLQRLEAAGRLRAEQAEQVRQWVAAYPGPPAEEAILCRFAPRESASGSPAEAAAELAHGELFPWLVAAASQNLVQQWQQALAESGREFLGLVPLACCAWAALGRERPADDALGQERPGEEHFSEPVELLLPGVTVRLHFAGGELRRVENLPGGEAAAGFVSGGGSLDQEQALPDRPVPARLRFLPLGAVRSQAGEPAELSAREMLQGLAAWAAGEVPEAEKLSPLRRPIPWVPPWRRPAWVTAACVVAWALVVLGLELPLRGRLQQARRHAAVLQQQVDRLEEAQERLQARVARAQRLQRQRDQLDQRLRTQRQAVARVEAAFRLRRRRMPELLEQLRHVVPAELVLYSLHWDTGARIALEGWATGPELVQEFVARVLEHLGDASPALVHDMLQQAPGPAGSPGVRFSLVVEVDLHEGVLREKLPVAAPPGPATASAPLAAGPKGFPRTPRE